MKVRALKSDVAAMYPSIVSVAITDAQEWMKTADREHITQIATSMRPLILSFCQQPVHPFIKYATELHGDLRDYVVTIEPRHEADKDKDRRVATYFGAVVYVASMYSIL